MDRVRLVIAICTTGMHISCGPMANDRDQAGLDRISARVDSLDGTYSILADSMNKRRRLLAITMLELREDLKVLEKSVTRLTSSMDGLEKASSKIGSSDVWLDPASDEYQILKTDIGFMTFSIHEVTAHADGSKVMLRVGNLTSATVNSAEFEMKWGQRRGSESWSAWRSSLHSKVKKITQNLKPGTWNMVWLTLSRVPPSKFGHLEVSMATTGLSMKEGVTN